MIRAKTKELKIKNFLNPLSGEAEERVDERSNVGVSLRRYEFIYTRSIAVFKTTKGKILRNFATNLP